MSRKLRFSVWLMYVQNRHNLYYVNYDTSRKKAYTELDKKTMAARLDAAEDLTAWLRHELHAASKLGLCFSALTGTNSPGDPTQV